MKRLILLSAVLVMILGAQVTLAASVSGATYYGTIRVTNNNTYAVSGVSANVSISTPDWITSGLLNSSANNAAVYLNGSDTAFMPGYGTNPLMVYIGSILQNSSVDATLYTTNVTGGKYAYFPGTTGMTVVDTPGLEPGSNCTIQFTIPITSSNYSILEKPGALRINNDGSGNITAILQGTGGVPTGYPSVISENESVGTNTSIPVGMPGYTEGDLIIAFVTTYDVTVSTLTAPGGWTELYNVANAPTYSGAWRRVATSSENATNTWTQSAGTCYYSWQTLSVRDYGAINASSTSGATSAPDPPNLVSGFGAVKTLWIAAEGSQNDQLSAPAGYLDLHHLLQNSAGVATSSQNITAASENPGAYPTVSATWVAGTIAIQGYTSISVSGLSGEVAGTLTQDGTNVWLTASGTSSTNTTAVTINNNASRWIWGASAPYLDDMKIYVGGNYRGGWEWQYAATFTDLSGNGNTGTPSFRTTCSSTNVTASLISFQPVAESQASENISSTWPSIVTTAPNEPSNTYSENATPGFFFANIMTSLWSLTALPNSLMWYNFAFFWIILVSILIFFFFQGKTGPTPAAFFIKVIAAGGMLIFFTLPGLNIYGFYVVIYYALFSFGLWVMHKDYGW